MSSELQEIQISEPLMQAIMGEYMQDLRNRKKPHHAQTADRLLELWENDPVFYPLVRQAISEAVVFSTLACSASNFEDFEREASNLTPIEDPMLSALRHDIFVSGVRCAIESIGFEAAAQLKTSDRVAFFEKITKSQDTED
jgi:hypothetical protein